MENPGCLMASMMTRAVPLESELEVRAMKLAPDGSGAWLIAVIALIMVVLGGFLSLDYSGISLDQFSEILDSFL